MAGTFLGISTALSSLQAQQAALDTVSHNIANANTPGYKRQRVLLGEGNPITLSVGANSGTTLGTGVHVQEIQRVQDDFVDSRVRQTTGLAAEWSAKSDTLSQVESVFNEPSDNGIATQLSKFWDAWEKVSANPDDSSIRNSLIGQAQTLTMQIRQSYSQLKNMSDDIDSSVKSDVDKINQITSQIADLNGKIARTSSSGVSPNDLLDQRDLLVNQLTGLAGVEVSGQSGQEFMVTLGNKVLVQGTEADQLGVRLDGFGVPEVFSCSTGESREIPGGEIAGLMDVRNNSLSGFMTSLDNFVTSLSTAVNTIHRTGFKANGVAAGDFFDPTTTAANFEVSAAILASPGNVATSDVATRPGNNNVSNNIAALRTQPLGAGSTLGQIYQGIITGAGTQSALAKQYADTQNATLDQFTAQQQSISGVSLDEEMTDMIKFQRCYGAAARVLTACDDMLSTLIDKTGLVGR